MDEIEIELRRMTMPPDARCSICGEPFESWADWNDRHTDSRGEDCHPWCCDICRETECEHGFTSACPEGCN